MQKTETLTIRKLMVKRADRWYIAEGEFEGMLDKS
jgi:hypothetical protein